MPPPELLSLPCALLILSLVSSQGSFVIRQEDVSISYLPLAHMFERMIQVAGPLLRPASRLFVRRPQIKVHLCHRSRCSATGPE